MQTRLLAATAALLVGLAILACSDDTPPGGAPSATAPPLDTAALATIDLTAVGGSGVAGIVSVSTTASSDALLGIEASGLIPGSAYESHLHAGTCNQASSSAGRLGTLAADGDGRAGSHWSAVAASAAGVTIDLSLELIGDGDHLIDLHGADGDLVACAAIPRLASGLPSATATPPTPLPASTGIEVVDAAVAAVLSGESLPLLSLAAYTEVECGPPAQGSGGPPVCRAGEPDLTPVDVMPAASCEGYYLRPDELGPTVDAFLDRELRLYAVFPTSPALAFFGGTHVVVFAARDAAHPQELTQEVITADRGIVGLNFGCGESPEDLIRLQGLDRPVLGPLSEPTPAATPSIDSGHWGDVRLVSQGIFGVDAVARIDTRARTEPVTLTIEAHLDSGLRYVAHLHGGTCAAPSASVGTLGELAADVRGHVLLSVRHVTAGATGETVDLTLDLLADGAHLIELHDPTGQVVACGEIPATGGR